MRVGIRDGIRVAVAVGIFAASCAARGQDEARYLTEREAVSLALDHGAEAQALRAEADIARSAIDIAVLRDPTTLTYSLYGRTSGNSSAINGTQHQLWVEQSILGSRRGARRDVATLASAAASREADAYLFEVELETRRRYAELVAALARVEIVQAARTELARIVAIIEGRSASGAHSRFDLVRARLDLIRLDARLARLTIESRAASARLAAQIGIGDLEARATDPLRVVAGGDLDDAALRHAFLDHPALAAARERVDAARAAVSLARRESRPSPSIGAGGYFTSDGRSSSLYGALSVPIAGGGRAAAFERHAEAMVAAEEARLALVERGLRTRLDATIAMRDQARDLAGSFDSSVGESLTEIRTMVVAAYEMGSAAAFELLGTYAATVDVELERIDVLEHLRAAEVELSAVTGQRLR